MSNMIMQPTPGPARRIVERFTGLVECEFASDGYLPPPYGEQRGAIPKDSKPRGGGSGGTARQPSRLQAQGEQGSQGLQVRPWAEHRTGTFSGSGFRQAAPHYEAQAYRAGDLRPTGGTR